MTEKDTLLPRSSLHKGSIYFLEGPKSRQSEFLFTLKVLAGFIKGFRKLHFIGPCITVVGAARFKEGHKHYEKAPQGFGLLYEGRLVIFYDYECDLGDGWEDLEVHNDPEEIRQKALQMGANILQYVFTHS